MSKHHSAGKLDPTELCSPGHVQHDGDRFGRMFPDLPALYTDPALLRDVGAASGPMQASGPANKGRTKTVPVGHVFFGQFIDHDITLDVSSSLDAVNSPSQTANARTPTLDLDCIYGNGPEASSYLYETSGPGAGAELIWNATTTDLQRNDRGAAIIGDHRNDENRIVSQLQLGMIKLHNLFCRELAATHSGHELFEQARREMTWHYQWTVVHDFLPTMCGPDVVIDVLTNGRRFYTPRTPYIPVEFSVAAYRFGHTMAPQRIQIQAGAPAHPLFGGTLGSFSPVSGPDEVVDWNELFDVPGSSAKWQRAEKCDQKLAAILLDLPFVTPPAERSLATRNLLRSQSFLLPSGEQVAAALERPKAEIAKVSGAATAMDARFGAATPLWLYILLEGATVGRGGVGTQKGEGLGPVGGRIVAEVLIGLLECDDRSWLATNRAWAPEPERSTIGQLLVEASTVLDLTADRVGAEVG